MPSNEIALPKSSWMQWLEQSPAIKKRVLIAADVSASMLSARSLFGPPAVDLLAYIIQVVAARAKWSTLIGVDWKGCWNQEAGLVYTKNPHGDCKPIWLKETEGVYQYRGAGVLDVSSLSNWLKSFGVPAVNMCLPFNWAAERRLAIDCFLLLTDRKTIAGNLPDGAWHDYTNTMAIQPRVANLCISLPRSIVSESGQKHDYIWETPFFANYTADALPELWRYMNGDPQEVT